MRDPSAKPAVYQVWHDHHWPQSRLTHVLGGGPEPPFPQSYTHVANVRAGSLAQAVELTTDQGSIFDGPGNWQPWRENPEVEVLVVAPRSTSDGDVIVDPQGKTHRVGREGFQEIGAAQSDPSDDAARAFLEQLDRVRPVTRNLIEAVLMDAWPHNAGVVDFGIDSQKHYEALYYPIREGEVMPKALDEALGHGEKLTALVREAPSNPHKDVEFHTSWDVMFGREGQKQQPPEPVPEPTPDRGRGR